MLKRITIEDNEKYLRQISSNVNFNNDDYKKEIEDLRTYCMNSECYALAPIQIGIPKRIIYIRNTSSDMTKNNDNTYSEEILYINPVIKKMYGHTKFLEGCGSCKYSNGNYVVGEVDRPYKIEIEYFDINGNKKNKTIEGFESTVFCHEYDHLDGILHMDRINESSLMTLDEMREYRTANPYLVIDKDTEFNYERNKVINVIEITIDEFKNNIYDKYISLFPNNERRKYNKIEITYMQKIEFFYKIVLNNTIIGFIMLEKLDNNHPYYLDYFAIYKEYQNKGYGKSALEFLLNNIISNNGLIAEIEKVDDNNSITVKRLRFYEQLGFKKINSVYLLDNVLYTPIVYLNSYNYSKHEIDKIFFDYYKINGDQEIKMNYRITKIKGVDL